MPKKKKEVESKSTTKKNERVMKLQNETNSDWFELIGDSIKRNARKFLLRAETGKNFMSSIRSDVIIQRTKAIHQGRASG